MTYLIAAMLNKQIATELGISEETVKIHRGRVMQKLGITSVVELVRLSEKASIVTGGNWRDSSPFPYTTKMVYRPATRGCIMLA